MPDEKTFKTITSGVKEIIQSIKSKGKFSPEMETENYFLISKLYGF